MTPTPKIAYLVNENQGWNPDHDSWKLYTEAEFYALTDSAVKARRIVYWEIDEE